MQRRDCLKNLLNITLAPLTPQFWGEIAQNFGFLPPFLWPCGLELGGWGGNAGMNWTFQTSS
jgi:hypothetical protein